MLCSLVKNMLSCSLRGVSNRRGSSGCNGRLLVDLVMILKLTLLAHGGVRNVESRLLDCLSQAM